MIDKRILAVDYGDVRTGLAISDSGGTFAFGIGYIACGGMRNTAERVAREVAERNAGTIVVGLPKNMDGTEGERAAVVRAFAALLSPLTDAEIVFFDERLSTAAAHRLLNQTDTRGAKRKARVDTLAAQIILQNYLDARANRK